MKRIAQLIDFTPTSLITEQFSTRIAQQLEAAVDSIHFCKESEKEDAKSKFEEYTRFLEQSNVPNNVHLIDGDLFKVTQAEISKLNSQLVVVGTHGKKGLKQHLFGADIVKLIRSLETATLIVSDECKIGPAGIQHIVFPVAAHEDFNKKIINTSLLAKAFDARVLIYQINRAGMEPSESVAKNTSAAISHFSENGIKYDKVENSAEGFSIGFADQILEYTKNLPNAIISIMRNVSDESSHSGKLDKEMTILNQKGIAILLS